MPIRSAATVWRADLDPGAALEAVVEEGRGVLVYVAEGDAVVADEALEAGDHARASAAGPLRLKSRGGASLLLVDVPLG